MTAVIFKIISTVGSRYSLSNAHVSMGKANYTFIEYYYIDVHVPGGPRRSVCAASRRG